ncbi:MAG: MerR family transcriptional regulator [Lachnospiraceae bacterium]|nr:MerR family transcriptional regulator [Lachnospiraceae bacterium]
MELQTINQVSKDYGISARMLRYYEQIGLIKSQRKEDYAYRVYDESAVNRLKQIIILRKLRVPVKQIINILNNTDAAETVEIFRQNIIQLDEEITALSTIKSILVDFVEEIRKKADINLNLSLLGDEVIYSVIDSLSFSQNHIKEEKQTMDGLNKANEELSKITDKDVRIVYLAPMTVAAAIASGDGCEGKTGEMIRDFVTESGLLKIKPDARCFGFDCSQGATGIGENSNVYQLWVSIPDDMEVPSTLEKLKFAGGMYAAHVLRDWSFEDWRLLGEWVNNSEKYANDACASRMTSGKPIYGQCLEETMNFYNFIKNPGTELQLDLLFPIKNK